MVPAVRPQQLGRAVDLDLDLDYSMQMKSYNLFLMMEKSLILIVTDYDDNEVVSEVMTC